MPKRSVGIWRLAAKQDTGSAEIVRGGSGRWIGARTGLDYPWGFSNPYSSIIVSTRRRVGEQKGAKLRKYDEKNVIYPPSVFPPGGMPKGFPLNRREALVRSECADSAGGLMARLLCATPHNMETNPRTRKCRLLESQSLLEASRFQWEKNIII